MAREFTLPDPGEGIHEAEIVEVKVTAGDHVSEGDVLAVVETDKAEVDVTSPFAGTIEDVAVSDGDDLRVGDVLLTYTTDGGDDDTEAADEPRDGGAQPKEEDEQPEDDRDGERRAEEEDEEPEDEARDEAQEDEEEEEGEGEEEKQEAEDEEGEAPAREQANEDEPPGPVPAAPTTRRLARELEVDLHSVEATGSDGRITDEDVRRAAGERPAEGEQEGPEEREERREAEAAGGALPPSRWPLTPRRAELPDFGQWGAVERVPLRSVRRATAQRMALAWSQVPHVTHEDIADITELERFRRDLAPRVEERGGKLTLTTLVVKAAVAALKEHPRFNASLDPEAGEIVLKRYYHIGVAVATERGLLVPVIRDVDRKTLIELAVELAELAERARDGDLDLAEMRGGSFSITNPGGIGGTRFTPIVNFPQVAILGCGRAGLEPVASGDLDSATVSHRFRLPLCLAFDHRVNDGADAARFVRRLCDILGDPEAFTLAV